jgi:GNAT superfamily N-acetyltransferase
VAARKAVEVAATIRARVGSDLGPCEAIAREVHRRDGYPPYLPGDDLRRFLAGEEHLGAWVAEESGTLVGHVALHRRSSEAVMSLATEALGAGAGSMAVVARLLVRPHRCRQGVGRLLLSEATAEAIRLGRQPILDVSTQFSAAVALYEAAGWQRLGTVVVLLGDIELAEHVYSYTGPGRPGHLAPPADVWLHHHLAVRASPIDGHGLFATQDIPAGTVVVCLGGRLVSSAELTRLITEANADPNAPYVDSTTLYEDCHLILPPGTDVHYGNHSCDPNTWPIGPYEIAARRDIPAGEEVTLDYATTSGAGGFSMPCRCGSALCRGQITSEDWRRPELQARYGDHWVPALQERIRRVSSQSAT